MAFVILGTGHRGGERSFTVAAGWCENCTHLKAKLECRPVMNLNCAKGLSSLIVFGFMEPKAKNASLEGKNEPVKQNKAKLIVLFLILKNCDNN